MKVYCKNSEIFWNSIFTTGKYYHFDSDGHLIGNDNCISFIRENDIKNGAFQVAFKLISSWNDI